MPDEVALTATDVSADALQLASENAVAHAVADRIEFEGGPAARRRGGSKDDLSSRTCRTSGPTRSRPAGRRPSSRRSRSTAARTACGSSTGCSTSCPPSSRPTPPRSWRSAATRSRPAGDRAAERLPSWSLEIERTSAGCRASRSCGRRRVEPIAARPSTLPQDGPRRRRRRRSAPRDRRRSSPCPRTPCTASASRSTRPGDRAALRRQEPAPGQGHRAAPRRDRAGGGDRRADAGRAALAAAFWPGGLTLVVPPRTDRALPGGAHRRRARARARSRRSASASRPRRTPRPRARARAAAHDLGQPLRRARGAGRRRDRAAARRGPSTSSSTGARPRRPRLDRRRPHRTSRASSARRDRRGGDRAVPRRRRGCPAWEDSGHGRAGRPGPAREVQAAWSASAADRARLGLGWPTSIPSCGTR